MCGRSIRNRLIAKGGFCFPQFSFIVEWYNYYMDEDYEFTATRIKPIVNFVPSKLNERQDILAQIHQRYSADKNLRKKENWTRYIQFLKENRTPDSKEMQSKFKKSRRFVREMDAKSLAIRLAHIKTKDLYYILSAGKDQKNFSAWLLSSIKSIS